MARIADPNIRNDILQAARACFAEKGYNSTRMSDIAKRAGVAVGTIYLHFKTKEACCAAFLTVANKRIVNESLPLLDIGPFHEALGNSMRASMRIQAEEQDVIKLLYLTIGFAPFENYQPSPIELELLERFSRSINARIASGECRPCDPAIILQLLANMMERTLMGCVLLGAGDMQAMTEPMIEFVQRALVVPPNTI